MSGERTPPVGIEWRNVDVGALSSTLRAMLGLPPEDSAPGEQAAALHRRLPVAIHGVDAGGWISWCLVGLLLFEEPGPPMARVRVEAKRVVMGLAMMRSGGNLSAAALSLGMSRKVLRDGLRAVGLYPWRVSESPGQTSQNDIAETKQARPRDFLPRP